MTDEHANSVPRTDEEFRDYVSESLREGRERMDRIEQNLQANTSATEAARAGAQEVLDILTAAKGGLKTLGWLGVALKWLAMVGLAVATLWALVTGKPTPGGFL